MGFTLGEACTLRISLDGSSLTLFWRDFAEAWKARGRAALEEVANNDPATFIRVAASLMPKELDIAGNVQHILTDRPVLIEDWKQKYAEVPGEKTH